jgi:periplasmic divalent cation tolerance protein
MIYCPFPDAASAQAAAQALVGEGLVACAQILSPIRSHYRWQGKAEWAEEVPLLAKLPVAGRDAAQARLLALHPYDLPAIVSWIADCAPDLERWASG